MRDFFIVLRKGFNHGLTPMDLARPTPQPRKEPWKELQVESCQLKMDFASAQESLPRMHELT
jgi:hypothetical protein